MFLSAAVLYQIQLFLRQNKPDINISWTSLSTSVRKRIYKFPANIYVGACSSCDMSYTHAKISHLVASLPTSRQQVVFALLVPSCQQVWNKLFTTCNNLVDIIRLVPRLFQQVRYSHVITILLQPCVVNLVTFLLYHDCIRLVRTTL
jgi:hypothetical protein